MKGHHWTPEETERLRGLVALGLSATQAAFSFPGRSRNAMLGHADRQGIRFASHVVAGTANKVKAAKLKTTPLPAPTHQKRKTSAEERAALLCSLEPVEGVLLENLTDVQCAYPVTETVPFRFCGRDRAHKKSRYCKDHGVVTHQKAELARL